MTPSEVTTILRQFNKWLRGNKDGPQLESREINQAINAAIEMIDHLEAAEKERSADSETPTIDWQSSCEMWKRAHEKVDRIASELQDTVHKQAHEIERLRYLVEKTYYIHPESGNLHQVLMDNLLADVAQDILESMK